MESIGQDQAIHAEPAWAGKKEPEQDDEIKHFRQIQNSDSQPSGDVALIFRSAVVAIATIITPLSITHARGVRAPAMSSKPKRNSTVETKRALNSGNGTRAFSNV